MNIELFTIHLKEMHKGISILNFGCDNGDYSLFTVSFDYGYWWIDILFLRAPIRWIIDRIREAQYKDDEL